MNEVLVAIAERSRVDRKFVDKLRNWQKAWVISRQAEINALYPHDESEYGSVLPMCRCTILAELTVSHTKDLMQWTSGIVEGDVCTGSRPIKK